MGPVARCPGEPAPPRVLGIARPADHLAGTGATARASAALAVIGGLVITRYVIGLTPLAEMSHDELVRWASPSVRAPLAPARRPTPRR